MLGEHIILSTLVVVSSFRIGATFNWNQIEFRVWITNCAIVKLSVIIIYAYYHFNDGLANPV